jgi:hypothetical protein
MPPTGKGWVERKEEEGGKMVVTVANGKWKRKEGGGKMVSVLYNVL